MCLPLLLCSACEISASREKSSLMPASVANEILKKYGMDQWALWPYVYTEGPLCSGDKLYIRLSDLSGARLGLLGFRVYTKGGPVFFGCSGGSVYFTSVKTREDANEVTDALAALGADLTD